MTGEQTAKKVITYYPKAALGKRIVAYIIDGLIGGAPLIIIVLIGLFLFIGQIGGYEQAGSFEDMIFSNLGSLIVIAVLFGLSLLWALFYSFFRDGFGEGQSWGKKAFGLMVVNLDDHTPCRMAKSFVRNIFAWLISTALSWIPALNAISGLVEPIVAMIHDKGQRIGDMVGNTQVVEVVHYWAGATTEGSGE